jgi:hypothetical protein
MSNFAREIDRDERAGIRRLAQGHAGNVVGFFPEVQENKLMNEPGKGEK